MPILFVLLLSWVSYGFSLETRLRLASGGDKELEEVVLRAYNTHLKPQEDLSLLINYIVQNFFKLGSQHYELKSEFGPEFEAFRNEIIKETQKRFALPKCCADDKKIRVTIVTGSFYNGGHVSAAKALEEELKDAFDVTVVDNQDVAFDHFDGMGALRRKIAETKPNFIISTLHHIPEITSLSHYLDVPLAVVITDFGFPFTQWDLVDQVQYPMVTYWIPTHQKTFFREMIRDSRLRIVSNWSEYPRTQLIQEQLFEAKKELSDILPQLEVFQIIGFPVAKVFEQPISSSERRTILEHLKLNLEPDRKLVTVSYGASTWSSVFSVFSDFLKELVSHQNRLINKIQLVILTGREEFLFSELEPLKTNHSGKLMIRFLPKLSYPVEIASLYKVTDLLLSKAGGATTAEIVATRTPYLRIFDLSVWEKENIKYLESSGLTVESIEASEILESMNKLLSARPCIEEKKITPFRRDFVKDLIKQRC